jgi:hypothetical protein
MFPGVSDGCARRILACSALLTLLRALCAVCRQGDVNLYTNAALKARQQLRTDADVSSCIRRQWAQLSIVNPDDPGECGVCLPARPMLAWGTFLRSFTIHLFVYCVLYAEERILQKDRYIHFFVHSAVVLVPDAHERELAFGSAHELREQLSSSWYTETAGQMHMTFAQFFSSFFELLDTWTSSTDKLDYIRLADSLEWTHEYAHE